MRVSCLMVTLPVPERLAPMTRAIQAYLDQTHPDRELVVVIDQGSARDRAAAASAVATFAREDIIAFLPDAPMTLGALRNLSVSRASGDAICQWDDDDLHHPRRIAEQLAAPARGDCAATLLQDVMLYDAAERALYWTNWTATPATVHPGTLLCLSACMPRYPETGPIAERGEDLALLQSLQASQDVRALADTPHLYVYVAHGANVSPPDHLAMLKRELSISRGLLLRREPVLRDGLAAFDFGPDAVSVKGSNGRAFSL